jgi:DNA-binding transcriptional MerR regulator
MFPAEGGASSGPMGERVFLSSDVSRMAAVSLRQLQWWDEQKVVSPRKEDHRRLYAPPQVLEVLMVAALRRKGLSLQKIRRVLRLLRRELGESHKKNWEGGSKLYVLTDGHTVRLESRPDRLFKLLTDATGPMYVVSMNDQVKRMASDQASRRYLAKQLPLF